MSYNIRNIREIPADPMQKFGNILSKKLSRFLTKDQLELLEDKEDVYTDGRDVSTVVKLHDELISTKTFDFTTQYFPPTEPDHDKMTLWLRGRNLGNYLYDRSGFNHEAEIFGEPLLVDGAPFDYGIHTAGVKSIAVRFNRPTSEYVNQEYVIVRDDPSFSVEGISIGMSYFIRFKIYDLAAQAGANRTLFEKTDNATPNDGVMLRVTSTGRLLFQIRRNGGTVLTKETDTGTIATNTVYEVWITYANAGDAIKIYVNNVDKTLSDGSLQGWHTDLTYEDMFVMRRGAGSQSGFVYGDLYDLIVMREKVVSSTEVGRHFTNKWTLADIPFGQVMIANYWATYTNISLTSSYTITSYTTTSYNT